MAKQAIIIWVLAVLLVVAIGYIGYNYYANAKVSEQTTLLNQGAQIGAQQAILSIFQQAATCQTVPLFYGNSTVNQTINIVAVECLQAAAQQQAAANAAK